MAFTVGLPGGTPNYEFEAYIRQLEKQGVNITDAPRVVDPVSGDRWVYAWSSRADAEAFATELRRESENEGWRVHELPGVKPSSGPLGPIEVLVSRRSDGCVYSLSHTSRKLVRKRFPQAVLAPNVLVATSSQADFEQSQRPIWGHVATILTGLSEEELRQLGGYRVIDPVEERVLRDVLPLSA